MIDKITKILNFPEEFREKVSKNLKEKGEEDKKEKGYYDQKIQETLTLVTKIEDQAQDYTALEFLRRMGRLELFRVSYVVSSISNIQYILTADTRGERKISEVKHDLIGSSQENLRKVGESHLRDVYCTQNLLDKFYSDLKKVDLVKLITEHYVYAEE